jgi:hypothetical protein
MDTPPPHETFETVFLDPKTSLFCYEGENLTYRDGDGVYYPRVSLRRCFPLSSENTNIVVRIPDVDPERSHELGMIEDIADLEESSREAVERELHLYYVVPSILRISNIREEFGFLYWTVETDRGPKEFVIRDSIISSTRQISKGRWLIIDINQSRYEIHNFETLDSTSQDLLRRYLLL